MSDEKALFKRYYQLMRMSAWLDHGVDSDCWGGSISQAVDLSKYPGDYPGWRYLKSYFTTPEQALDSMILELAQDDDMYSKSAKIYRDSRKPYYPSYANLRLSSLKEPLALF